MFLVGVSTLADSSACDSHIFFVNVFLVIFNYVVLTQEVQPPRPEATTNAEALIDSPVELERFFLMQSNSVRRSMFSTG